MKISIVVFTFFLVSACDSPQTIPYEKGLEHCQQLPDCLIGAKIPDFTAKTMQGKSIDGNYFKGKVSIINFWFSTCAPCVAEIPGFNKIVEKFGADRVNYLAVGRDDAAEVTEFLQEHPWKFDQIADGSDLMYKVFKLKFGFPTTFVLNKKAEIILAFAGGMTDSTAVDKIQERIIPVIEAALGK